MTNLHPQAKNKQHTGYSNNGIFYVIFKNEIMMQSYTYISFIIFLQTCIESSWHFINILQRMKKEILCKNNPSLKTTRVSKSLCRKYIVHMFH